MTAPAASGQWLVCGCWSGGPHESWCAMGEADRIAREATEAARVNGDPQLLAALVALTEAGLLKDIEDGDPDQVLAGVLDMLWEANLLGPREPGVVSPS